MFTRILQQLRKIEAEKLCVCGGVKGLTLSGLPPREGLKCLAIEGSMVVAVMGVAYSTCSHILNL